MPNWVMGYCGVAGTKENIKRFLLNQLKLVDFAGEKAGDIIVEGNVFRTPVLGTNYRIYHIKDTYRCFIEPFTVDFNNLEEDENGNITLNLYIKGAWIIKSEPLAEISKKYHISFMIEAEEESGEFEQVIYVKNGEIIEDEEITIHTYRGNDDEE